MEIMHRTCLNYFYASLFSFAFLNCAQSNEGNHTWVSLSDDLPYEYLFSHNLQRQEFPTRSRWIRETWYDARRWCRENGGGDLLTIKSNLEVNLLLDKMLEDEPENSTVSQLSS